MPGGVFSCIAANLASFEESGAPAGYEIFIKLLREFLCIAAEGINEATIQLRIRNINWRIGTNRQSDRIARAGIDLIRQR